MFDVPNGTFVKKRIEKDVDPMEHVFARMLRGRDRAQIVSEDQDHDPTSSKQFIKSKQIRVVNDSDSAEGDDDWDGAGGDLKPYGFL